VKRLKKLLSGWNSELWVARGKLRGTPPSFRFRITVQAANMIFFWTFFPKSQMKKLFFRGIGQGFLLQFLIPWTLRLSFLA